MLCTNKSYMLYLQEIICRQSSLKEAYILLDTSAGTKI
jgi:hypothetical protein